MKDVAREMTAEEYIEALMKMLADFLFYVKEKNNGKIIREDAWYWQDEYVSFKKANEDEYHYLFHEKP